MVPPLFDCIHRTKDGWIGFACLYMIIGRYPFARSRSRISVDANAAYAARPALDKLLQAQVKLMKLHELA